jgi:hypothetical protein
MTALAKQASHEVARPLKTLERLIKEDIEAGERQGMDYWRSAGEKLNEAQDGHFDGDAAGFWRWAEKSFGKTKTQLRVWMAYGSHSHPKRFKTQQQFEKDALGYESRGVRPRRDWTVSVSDVADRARNEARRLAAEDALTHRQEREAEAKLGLRLIDIGYRVLAKELHPDKGGSREAMHRLGRVRDRLRSNV